VNLSAGRTGNTLSLELRSAFQGALPDWVGVEATILSAGGDDHSSVWIPVTCDLEPGQFIDRFEITGIETIGHEPGQAVASAARRWGLGEALVLPWNPLSGPNTDARPLVEQALEFLLRPRERSAVAGLATPVTIGVANTGGDEVAVRVEVEAPPDQVLEVWGDPVGLDPVVWHTTLAGGSSARHTIWFRPPAACCLSLPFAVSAHVGDEWVTVASGVREIAIDETSGWELLRELRITIATCASSTDDDAIRSTLRDVQASVERFAIAAAGTDGSAQALRELSAAFAAIENEDLPCFAGLRKRLADQLALWQARWVSSGSSP
jgi:hypothetical protein